MVTSRVCQGHVDWVVSTQKLKILVLGAITDPTSKLLQKSATTAI